MTCDTCKTKMYNLDNGERLPLGVVIHIARCNGCMETWNTLKEAYAEMRETMEFPATQVTETVMEEIGKEGSWNVPAEGVSMRIWLAAGAVLLGVMLFSVFAEPFVMARLSMGDLFLMPMSLVFGIVLSVYSILFILSNLAFFVRFIRIAGFCRQ